MKLLFDETAAEKSTSELTLSTSVSVDYEFVTFTAWKVGIEYGRIVFSLDEFQRIIEFVAEMSEVEDETDA